MIKLLRIWIINKFQLRSNSKLQPFDYLASKYNKLSVFLNLKELENLVLRKVSELFAYYLKNKVSFFLVVCGAWNRDIHIVFSGTQRREGKKVYETYFWNITITSFLTHTLHAFQVFFEQIESPFYFQNSSIWHESKFQENASRFHGT